MGTSGRLWQKVGLGSVGDFVVGPKPGGQILPATSSTRILTLKQDVPSCIWHPMRWRATSARPYFVAHHSRVPVTIVPGSTPVPVGPGRYCSPVTTL